jgi:DNA-binding GntR family transcriptional regulator
MGFLGEWRRSNLWGMAGEEPPKYRQVAEHIRARIASGEYAPGSRLPSKAELLHQYGVALGTLDKAIAELRQQGYVETVQGVGMFACEPPPTEEDLTQQVKQLSERVAALEGRMAGLETGRDVRR